MTKVAGVAAFILLSALATPSFANSDTTQQQKKHANAANPAIAKVVDLINELSAKTEADGKSEQKLYDKFACWCEKTTARKAAAIEEAKARIEELQSLINELSGKLGTLGAEISQLEKDVAENEAGTKEATELRSKEQDEYLVERSDSEQCIGALENAVKVMTGAGEGGAASALQETEVLSVAAGVRSALRQVPEDSVSKDDMETVKKFVNHPVGFWASRAGAASFAGVQTGSQNPMGDYAPASAQIQGILKGMYDDFTARLEEANAEEATKQKEFEELMATKKAELDSLKATLTTKSGANADGGKQLADSKEEREATEKQLAQDEKFFEETKAACKAKAMAWAERSRLRTEELAGMKKAVEILTSEEMPAAAAVLLQLRSRSVSGVGQGARMRHVRQIAFDQLKALVKTTRSMRIASLAAMVRSTEVPDGGAMDAFAPVIEAIDKMIGELRAEEQEDIEHRDFCESKENKLKNQEEDLQYKIGQKEGLIERLEAVEKKLDMDIDQVKSDIQETEEAMAEALATRNDETAEFKKALKDDSDTARLIAGAVEALTSFYVNNKLPLPASLMQKQKAPEYKADPDQAPGADFSDPSANSSQSGGIISILKMLKEDLENEIAQAKKDEQEAAAEFAEARKTSLAALDASKEKQADLETQKADTREKINQTDEDIQNAEDQKEGKIEEQKALAPNCDWLKGAFDKRRKARKAEIEGLIQAKAVLQGAAPALIQQKASPTFLARA